MKYIVDVQEKTVVGPWPDAIKGIDAEQVPLSTVVDYFSRSAYFDTGLLPLDGTGILSIRSGFGYLQIVIQIKPGNYLVKWGYSENDANAKMWDLAHPWRILIADFRGNNLLGVRHFYSPEPIHSWDQPLFHTNLPNTNCRGYSGTSVGWTCLYHTDDTSALSIAELANYAMLRESGASEPYNDRNMSETDGPRFYHAQKKPEFMYVPQAWSDKTAAEGYEWILNSELLVPILVSENDEDNVRHFTRHVKNGNPYTLRQASYGLYSAYYDDHLHSKPFNIIATQGYDALQPDSLILPLLSGLKGQLVDAFGTAQKGFSFSQAINVFKQSTSDLPQWAVLKTLKSLPCDYCGALVDVNELTRVGYEFLPEATALNQYGVSKWEQWCHNCVDDYTIATNHHYFYVGSLQWSDIDQIWLLPACSFSCSNCGSVFDKIKHKPGSVLVEPNRGCVCCQNEHEDYFLCALSNKLWHIDYKYSYTLDHVKLNNDSSLEIVKQEISISSSLIEDGTFVVCACDILQRPSECSDKTTPDGKKICFLCVGPDGSHKKHIDVLINPNTVSPLSN